MRNVLLLNSIRSLSDNLFIHVFMIFILIDLLSGLAKAVKLKKANSSIGLNGLIRHALIIFIVLMFSIYLPLFGLSQYVIWILGYFIIQYSISIIENLGEIGFPIPTGVKKVVYKLNETFDEKIDGKLLKIDTMVINKQENIDPKDINKSVESDG